MFKLKDPWLYKCIQDDTLKIIFLGKGGFQAHSCELTWKSQVRDLQNCLVDMVIKSCDFVKMMTADALKSLLN